MYEDCVTISNLQESGKVVAIEPWARSVELAPTAAVRITARSPIEGRLEVLYEELGAVVFAWEGATLQVWSGDQLIEGCDIAVPEMPRGMGTRGFLQMVFGLEPNGGKS